MINTNIYKKHNYLNKEIDFINNASIIEYDMKNAGLSIIYHNNILSKKDYDYLMSLDKLEKNVKVGKFLRDNPDINNFLMEEFINIREIFFDLNSIKEEEVLSIKKDSITLINKFPNYLIIDDFYEFRNKGSYKSYININNKEHYLDNSNNLLITKGYSQEIKDSHNKYLFNFIKKCLKYKIINNEDQLFEYCIKFKDDFIKFNLNKEYYLDIINSKYLFKIFDKIYYLDDIDEELNKKDLFINNNLSFIIECINKIL